MEKVYYRKLVRDKIPEIIASKGEEYEARVMDDVEFEKELKNKLLEEAKEVQYASIDKIALELADILEVVKTLTKLHNMQLKDIVKIQRERRKTRGGFDKQLFLMWATKK